MMLLGHSSPHGAHARRMSKTLQELTSPHWAQLELISYTLTVTLPSVVGLSIQKGPSTLKSD